MRELILTFLVGAGASIISGLIGAGGGAVRVPYLLLLGFPPQLAVGTGKFGAFGVTLGSLAKFRKTGHIRWDMALVLTLVGLPSAYVGLSLLLSLNDQAIKTMVAFALLLTASFMVLNRGLGLERRVTTIGKRLTGYVADFFIGMLQAGFSSGFGMLSMPVYMYFLGMTALEANATSKIPGAIKMVLVFTIVVTSGIVAWGHAVALLLGSIVGSYIGTHVAIKKGNRFVKVAYAVMLIAMSVKLLVDL